MALLQTFINEAHTRPSLAIFQSTASQTSLPILRYTLSQQQKGKGKARHQILFSLLHAPSDLIEPSSTEVEVHDWLDNVPGYSEDYFHPGKQILSTLDQALNSTSGEVDVVIDSIDSLLSDIGLISETYKILRDAHTKVTGRPGSTLILHGTRVDLISLITQTSFTSSLVHIKGHPTAIVDHIAVEYLTPPPVSGSQNLKFWSIFLPLSQRQSDVNELVFGTKGEGSGDSTEIVVEILVRGVAGRKRNVERELEAWSLALGPCHWDDLELLRPVWSKQTPSEAPASADPTQNLSFNLALTTAQQEARSQVPLPYVHEGQPVERPVNPKGVIFYDPDSADDIDDDDPDEDLDI